MSIEGSVGNHTVTPLPLNPSQQAKEDYLSSPSWSASTKKEYRRELTAFRSFLGHDLLEATRKEVEGYLAYRLDQGSAKATVARILAAIRGYFRYAMAEGLIGIDPTGAVRAPKVADTSPRLGLSREEAKALLAVIDPSTPIGTRDRALLMILLTNALRINEALEMKVEDVKEEAGHKVVAIVGKGDKPALVPLAPASWAAIMEWLAAAKIEEGFVFRNMTKGGKVGSTRMSARGATYRVQWLAKKAGIDKHISPHSFRHTAITLALDAGQPLHLVQDMARHADPRTTRRYDQARNSLNNPVPQTLVAALVED